MFAQIVIGSNDIAAARIFYDAVLATVGVPEGDFNEEIQRIYYRTSDGTFVVTKPVDGNPATVANGGTLGFKCKTPEQAKAFHDAAVANGGVSIEDPPGWRNLGERKVYLAYVRDPSGHKLCATHYA
jgi:catechol 2,3-dioxygenase-like lactoylglutathione lyase family enzyme